MLGCHQKLSKCSTIVCIVLVVALVNLTWFSVLYHVRFELVTNRLSFAFVIQLSHQSVWQLFCCKISSGYNYIKIDNFEVGAHALQRIKVHLDYVA